MAEALSRGLNKLDISQSSDEDVAELTPWFKRTPDQVSHYEEVEHEQLKGLQPGEMSEESLRREVLSVLVHQFNDELMVAARNTVGDILDGGPGFQDEHGARQLGNVRAQAEREVLDGLKAWSEFLPDVSMAPDELTVIEGTEG